MNRNSNRKSTFIFKEHDLGGFESNLINQEWTKIRWTKMN